MRALFGESVCKSERIGSRGGEGGGGRALYVDLPMQKMPNGIFYDIVYGLVLDHVCAVM